MEPGYLKRWYNTLNVKTIFAIQKHNYFKKIYSFYVNHHSQL